MNREVDDIELATFTSDKNENNQSHRMSHNPQNDSRVYDQQDDHTVLCMITISGVLGIGLYVRSGEILRLGGPAAVLSSFAVLAFIAWAVMQCIAEMLCIWPVPGALVEFVRAFVDDELGIVVGVAYWFTYSINLSALITATAIEARLFQPAPAVEVIVLFIMIPGVLFAINSLGVALYGFVEVIGVGLEKPIGSSYLGDTSTKTSPALAKDWGSAFFMALSIAAFQFIGVEIPAATALEARMSSSSEDDDQDQTLGTVWLDRGPATAALQFSATKLPIIAGVVYFISGLLVSLDISWTNPNLPVSWAGPDKNSTIRTNSAFVITAETTSVKGLGGVMTVFLMFTALTAANTALYVSSRTLFNYWQPAGGQIGEVYRSPPYLLDVLAQMGSVSCIIVWAYAIEKNTWYDAGQPWTAYLALTACLTILVVANGAALWRGPGSKKTGGSGTFVAKFAAAYLAPICFVGLWVALKFNRSRHDKSTRKWKPKDLSEWSTFVKAIDRLDKLRDQPMKVKLEPPTWRNLWGLI
ncbi:hypothetical protein KCU67_g2751, partial [Aureobasidium melanogenum]